MNEDEEGVSYHLLLPFDTDNPEFARGWEAGRMYEQVRSWADDTAGYRLQIQAHWSNAEIAMRIGGLDSLTVSVEQIDDDWAVFYFERADASQG